MGVALVAAALVVPAAPASADAGLLDPAYGKGGIAEHVFAEPWTAGYAAAGQADGKVVVVGEHGVPARDGKEWAVMRLTAAGEPDPDFGIGGFTTTTFGAGNSRSQGVMIDGEGRILVTGYARMSGRDHGVLVRYLSTGAPDPGFGTDGVVDLGAGFYPTSVAPRPGLGAAVAGGALPEATSPAFVSRVDAVTSTGAPDPSFDGDGTAVFDLSQDRARDSQPQALLGRADGSLVFAGNAGTDGGGDGFMVGFVGADGKLTHSAVHPVGSGGQASARALAEGPGGTVVTAGYALDAETNRYRFALARYDDQSALDPSFASGGVLLDSVGNASSRAYGVAVGDKGQVLAGGTSDGRFALARYDARGARDAGFGSGGEVLTPLTSSADARALVLFRDPDTVVLAGSSGVRIGAARYLGALGSVAGPVVPVASVADTSVTEGTGGTSTATVTVGLSEATTVPTSVAWSTSDGSATAPDDYTSASGTLSFAPGQTSATFSVGVVPDAVDEPNETFTVELSSPSGLTIGDGSATVLITDDDEPPTSVVSVQPAAPVAEGETLHFPVVLSSPASSTVTVDVATEDGTATAPGDYTAAATTLTFETGETEADLAVTTRIDSSTEPDETVVAHITGSTGPVTIGTGSSPGTITDATPVANVGTATATEGQKLRFPVTLSRPATGTITLRFTTQDGTATAPGDYTAVTSPGTTLTFAPGTTTQYFEVTTNADAAAEGDETLKARLLGGSGFVATPQLTATGTIEDGVLPPQLHRQILTGPVTGSVKYQVPGHDWMELHDPTPLPMGTLIDTSQGTVVVTFAVPPRSRASSAAARTTKVRSITLRGGVVRVAQHRGVPTLVLEGGTFAGCHGSATVRGVTVTSKGRTVVLGKYAATTLRKGTVTVLDRCSSTKVSVATGVAEAAPRKHPREVRLVRAGQSAVIRR